MRLCIEEGQGGNSGWVRCGCEQCRCLGGHPGKSTRAAVVGDPLESGTEPEPHSLGDATHTASIGNGNGCRGLQGEWDTYQQQSTGVREPRSMFREMDFDELAMTARWMDVEGETAISSDDAQRQV